MKCEREFESQNEVKFNGIKCMFVKLGPGRLPDKDIKNYQG